MIEEAQLRGLAARISAGLSEMCDNYKRRPARPAVLHPACTTCAPKGYTVAQERAAEQHFWAARFNHIITATS